MKTMTMSVFALAIFAFAGQALGQMGDYGTAATNAAKQQAASGTERRQ